MITHCKHCGRLESEHCDGYEPRIPRPTGCRCDPESWQGASKVTPICDRYDSGSGDSADMCMTCEHDRECHADAQP